MNVNKNNENTQGLTKSQTHYQMVKKDFKQMYNYSKDIVEKLHLLNNTIKIESADNIFQILTAEDTLA